MVGFDSTVSAAEQQKILKKAGALEQRKFSRIHGSLATAPPDAVQATIERLRSDPHVRYAEPNALLSIDTLPNDPLFNRLWGLNNTGQAVNYFPGLPDADIDAPEAWSVTTGSSNVTVAVIDTGMDYTHPDLGPQLWINPGENCSGCRSDGIDNDGNGYVDDWRGWDFANHDNAPFDDHGHGTHVAGTIGAAGNNGIGIAGVDWRVQLMPLKFLSSSGEGSVADAVSAILYATAQGANVINASWGGDAYSQALADAISAADARGILFVAAAGNSSSDNDASPAYPASYDLPNVISVAATDNYDRLAWFSNFGKQTVDLGAPGVNIYSTWPGSSYQYQSGTSMAAPQVTGSVALIKAAFSNATGPGIKALLLSSADPDSSLSGRTLTGGRLNVASAVSCTGTPKLWVDSPTAGFAADVGRPLTINATATECATPGSSQLSASVNGTPITLNARADGLYTGSYTPTGAGQLSLTFTASAAGRTASKTITGIASQVLAITPGGPPLTLTTTIPDQNARLRFDGQAGQRISLALSSVSISTSLVSIFNPDGSALVSNAYVTALGAFIDTRTLPVTGSYTILVDPQGAATGSITLRLYDVPPDSGGSLTAGGSSALTTSVPGQNMRPTFAAAAGQRISLNFSAGLGANVSVLNPDGSTLGGTTYVGALGGFVDTRTLPAAGTYTILVDPMDAATGSTTLSLYDVPPDASTTLDPGGAAQAVTLGTPGQNARLSFTGRSGQRVSLTLSSSSISSATAWLLKPDGSTLGANAFFGTSGGFLDTRTLPADGIYTFVIDPQGAATGSVTAKLVDVPPDLAAPITPGGPALTIGPLTAGQNARLSFDGHAGQRLSLRLSADSIPNAYVSFLKSDGSTIGSSSFVSTPGGFLDTRVLPADGTYTVLIDPLDASTGSTTATLYDVGADVTGTLAIGDPPLTVAILLPGQNARIALAGNAGQAVTLAISPLTLSVSFVSILRPDGTTLSSTIVTSARTMPVTLPASGTYTVLVDPLSDITGSLTLAAN